ncbi:Uncharacterized protein TCAP_04967 [Tolypocladium capitatum]|uniref:Uncharacterized protein n=1 Tax=Tolypocladium capitatum TaxID=45235 RepID=A0A2K3QC35_9HYPO|nr:Uncharacterized protein TCAP_04967 [Tolypocladium capitatum]
MVKDFSAYEDLVKAGIKVSIPGRGRAGQKRKKSVAARELAKAADKPTPTPEVHARAEAEARKHNPARYTIGLRVGIGCGSAILEVAIALGGRFPRDADGSAAIGNAPGKLVDRTRLMATSEAQVVILAVFLDAFKVVRLQLLDGIFDMLHAALDSHLLRGESSMVSRWDEDEVVQALPVPITANGLGVPGNLDTQVLSDAGEEVPCNPEMVAH